MRRLRNEYILLAGVLILGAALRLWGIDFGLPYTLHNDEPIVVNHAVAYGTGDLNPHFFIIPPLCSYLVFIFYGMYFVAGKLAGMFAHTRDFGLLFFTDPTSFYLIARVFLGVLPGTLCIWGVYVLYRRFFPEARGALFAALVVAVSFLAVVNSHYAYTDSMMLLFILAAYFFMAGMMRAPSIKNYLLSGIFIGLAVSTKYNAGLLAVSFAIAHASAVLCRNRKKSELIFGRYLWAAVGVSLLVFIMTNPFAVLDWRFFLQEGVAKIRSRGMGWTYHITYSLFEGMGPALLVAGFAGCVLMLFWERLSNKLLFFSFPLAFYLHLVFQSQRFSRYGLPLVPFLAIGAAYFLFRAIMSAERTRLWRALVYTIAALTLAPTLAKTVKADMLFALPDTREVSARWIEDNIPPGAKIAVDHTAYRPMIYQSPEQLEEKYALAGSQKALEGAKKEKLRYLIEATRDRKTYDVFFLEYGEKKDVLFLSETPVITGVSGNIRKVKDSGIEYVVVNYNTYADLEGVKEELEKMAEVAAVFSPYLNEEIRQPRDRTDHTYMSVDSAELFSRKAAGPCLVIYRMKPE